MNPKEAVGAVRRKFEEDKSFGPDAAGYFCLATAAVGLINVLAETGIDKPDVVATAPAFFMLGAAINFFKEGTLYRQEKMLEERLAKLVRDNSQAPVFDISEYSASLIERENIKSQS